MHAAKGANRESHWPGFKEVDLGETKWVDAEPRFRRRVQNIQHSTVEYYPYSSVLRSTCSESDWNCTIVEKDTVSTAFQYHQ